MSEAEEIQLGQQNDAEIRKQMGVYQDATCSATSIASGSQLARSSHRPNLPWTFTVVDESAVNAFALPGGFIYVTRGILPFLRNEAELAAVLGHEIGHVDGRHSAERVFEADVRRRRTRRARRFSSPRRSRFAEAASSRWACCS